MCKVSKLTCVKLSLFCDLIFDTNLVQLVETSTHSAGHILDLVLTNQHSNIQNLTLDSKPPSQLISDHLMIRFDIICDIGSSDKTTNPICSLNYSKANWEGINQFLSQYNFDLLFSLPDSDTKWAFIKNAILEAVHQFTPCVRSRSQYRPRWFNSEIQHQLNCIHTMRRTARAKPTQYNITKLETAEQQLSLDIQKAKQSFESSIIQNLQSNPTKVYKYISSIKSESQIPSSVYLETCMQLQLG